MKKLDYHAKLVVIDLATMKPKDIRRLAIWLQAKALELGRLNLPHNKKERKNYNKLFIARLMK